MTSGLLAEAARAYQAHDYETAERCCLALIEQDPRHFDALHLQGVLCLDRSQLPDAVGYLTRATTVRPYAARAHYHLGTALLQLKLPARAAAALRHAADLEPGDTDVLTNLGNALAGEGNHAEAVACYRHVLARDPRHAPAHYNLGCSLEQLHHLEDAVASFHTALQVAPAGTHADRMADVYSRLGQTLVALGRHDEALAACQAMAAAQPQVAAWNASLIHLLCGDYARGWRLYEGRWGVSDHDPPRPGMSIPELGEMKGRRVLLFPEQGHGDMIQFARYAPLLAAQGARVTLQTYPELLSLMQTLDGVEHVIALGKPVPQVDFVTPLLSLPMVFATTPASIPAQGAYLEAPVERQAAWRQRLGARRRPRVGLAWWGSQHIPKRSLPIDALSPLLSCSADFEVHALQKEIPATQRAWLAGYAPVMLYDADLHDFADTAALIGQLDLVVTIDTSIAHLAGALGVPVWIMLPHSADWRWMLGRDDSPWYPSARLFRQRRPGDWGGVVADVVRALAEVACSA